MEINNYFIILFSVCMSSPLSVCQSLECLRRSLCIKPGPQNQTPQDHQTTIPKSTIQNCKDSYRCQVERSIVFGKTKIDDLIKKVCSQIPDNREILPIERVIFRTLQQSLTLLNNNVQDLLRKGILTLYINLSDLKEKASGLELHRQIGNLIKTLIEPIQILLRVFLVYQEYTTQRSYNEKAKAQSIFSLRNLNRDYKQREERYQPLEDIDEKLMRHVEEYLSTKSIHHLFSDYMRNEELLMEEAEEVCRICSAQVKLFNMERHVKSCQQKYLLKRQLEQKYQQFQQIFDSLRERYNQINEKTQRTEQDDKFRRVAKALLFIDRKKERTLIRRCSVGVKSQKSSKEKVESYIEQYEEEEGEHEILHQMLENCRQRRQIEKKLNSVEISCLNLYNESRNENQNKITSSKHSTQSGPKMGFHLDRYCSFQDRIVDEPEQVIQPQSKTYKNIYQLERQTASEIVSSNYASSISNLESNQRLWKFESEQKRVTNQEHFKFDEDSTKHYVSLQDIVFEEDEQIQISLESFDILKILGQGAFGKVYLGRRKQTKDIYALKIIQISEQCGKKQIETIKNEHEIFKKIAGDHLVMAPFSFSEKESHVFVLEYLPGGDLKQMLNSQVYFEEDQAQFYLAEIILAIEHLHKFEIIHRDLKPDNLVIDRNGHLKLTDFGLSEFKIQQKLQKSKQMQLEVKDLKRNWKRRSAGIWGKSNLRLIGTPDYIAPEIINHISINNYTIDWWSLGVIAYQLLIGTRPFCSETIEGVVDNITNFNLEWPEEGISDEAKDLIIQLLNRDFTQRLGVNGADQIKQHPFFKDVDWDNIKKSKPSFIPKIKLKEIDDLKQDKQLRKQVSRSVGLSSRHNKRLKLQKFVRFDILGTETMENAEKTYEQKSHHIQKLKSIHKLQLENMDIQATCLTDFSV